ncbi:MAG: DNA repair protein RadA [Bacteriovoracaceae bacterium]|nr:DNA repair protein RadA [Bacteriovoracaceae bacterium]
MAAAKTKTQFECQECGYKSAKWLGKCPECGQWNSFVEEIVNKTKSNLAAGNLPGVMGHAPKGPILMCEVSLTESDKIKTGISELDRVLGNGLTLCSVVLVGGEPGIGKSTLLLELCGNLGLLFSEEKVLYVSGEESESQVSGRAHRLGIKSKNIYLQHETRWEQIVESLRKIKPKFLVLDSIQTTVSENLSSAGGTVSQIREVTYELVNLAKAQGITTFVIGHVTKEGNIAGPKVLEHMVDTVLYFEGDQNHFYRIVRAVKNRFGNCDEVGLFEMGSRGLIPVENPSLYFLDKGFEGSFGRSVTCIMEGSRPLFLEIQALVVENRMGNGRRTTQGIDQNRLSMLVAIIEKYFDIQLSFFDIFVNLVGGMKVTSRDADLSIIASILSSYFKHGLSEKWVFIGEVGLTGEIRPVPQQEQRIKELEKFGHEKVFLSSRSNQELLEKYQKESDDKSASFLIPLTKITELGPYVSKLSR